MLQAIVDVIPPPTGDASAPLKAMLVDSWYDPYLGVVILVRVIDGCLKRGAQVKFMQAGTVHLVDRVGCFRPKIEQLSELGPGEIGFITAQIKEVAETRVGDTITDARHPAAEALPGFKLVQPVVFCGLFPVDANDFEKLRDSPLQAAPQRRLVQLRDGDQRRAGLRLPLRLSWIAPSGDHPGAADPRI